MAKTTRDPLRTLFPCLLVGLFTAHSYLATQLKNDIADMPEVQMELKEIRQQKEKKLFEQQRQELLQRQRQQIRKDSTTKPLRLYPPQFTV